MRKPAGHDRFDQHATWQDYNGMNASGDPGSGRSGYLTPMAAC